MNKVAVWLAAGLTACFLFWLLAESLIGNLQAGRSLPVFSTYRYDPLGTAAFYHYLRETGNGASRLAHPLLSSSRRGVLIAINPPFAGGKLLASATLTNHYRPRLMRWIRRGNTLLEVTSRPTGLTRHEHILVHPMRCRPRPRVSPPMVFRNDRHFPKRVQRTEKATTQPLPHDLAHHMPGGHDATARQLIAKRLALRLQKRLPISRIDRRDLLYFTHRNPDQFSAILIAAPWLAAPPSLQRSRRQVWLIGPSAFTPQTPAAKKAWHPLIKCRGHILAMERRFGRGHIVLLGSPWPLVNGGIAAGGNLNFLMAIIGRKPAIFDEWGLGIGGPMTMLELFARFGLKTMLLQLLLIAAVLVWYSRGFPHRPPAADIAPAEAPTGTPLTAPIAANVQQILMLGRLYKAGMNARELGIKLAAEMQTRLAAALRVGPSGIEAAQRRLSADLQGRIAALRSIAQLKAGAMVAAPGRKPTADEYQLAAKLLNDSANLCQEIKRERKNG